MGAAVGLQVEALDLDHAHFGDALGQQVDLGADQVGDLEGFFPGQDSDFQRVGFGYLSVDGGFDLGRPIPAAWSRTRNPSAL